LSNLQQDGTVCRLLAAAGSSSISKKQYRYIDPKEIEMSQSNNQVSRRGVMTTSLGLAVAAALPFAGSAQGAPLAPRGASGTKTFPGGGTITTKDGMEIFYKDWGAGQPIVFHHGWPLSADDWDAQMRFFALQG
jgi:non-heme chloroperoxidase